MRQGQGTALEADWRAFGEAQAEWLPDYCLFMALKRHFGWQAWTDWPREIALREPEALARWREELGDEIGIQSLSQFLFGRQWQRVHTYANAAGIRIIGDMPIFVGHDSADVWSHRELYYLDDAGQPTVIAGVPPDYFSPTGQRWGNPHYRWGLMRETGYAWWLARLRRTLSQIDMVRLDHFRGFSGYWEVPASEETAMHGRWVKGPGPDFFHAVERALGKLPIIAEDLGVITEDVDALRKQFGLPGMRVLQFAFDGDPANHHLPHNYTPDSVVYSGTHDNDTTQGWYRTAPVKIKNNARLYTGTDGHAIHWDFLRLAMTSCADMAIVPLQDVLGLGSEARINAPGVPHGNWTWRYRQEMLQPATATALAAMADVTGRWLPPKSERKAVAPTVLDYEEPAE
jgi:4-alpha-glucanotransferase